MKIGIVGLGIVGSAIKYGFEKLGHNVKVHDIKLETSLQDLIDTKVIFVCVPTPALDNNFCDTSVVESVIDNLNNYQYQGIVAIKSTVQPGTTEKLIQKYTRFKIAFVPEFLRERCAIADFTENHDICIIGTTDLHVFECIKEIHGKYPKQFSMLSPTEAELSKYFNNIYNATLITFANSFYEVCKNLDADYTKIKNTITQRDHIEDIYLDCNDNIRGFGGVCLPKDLKAIAAICKNKNLNVEFFQNLLKENSKYKTTVFDGMRLK